ncbi:MAG: hypothetical protein Kow0077_13880 [Anaerolineae bacterium]
MVREAVDVRWAAFNITAAFEGGGYHSYQNHDSGVVSYGRFQFTLASGSLYAVLERYIAAAVSETAAALRDRYLPRVRDRDAGLRDDEDFRHLLDAAADDPAMQAAQDGVAREKYWDLVQGLSILPRNIQTALGQALIFDMAINHGPRHDMIGLAEKALGVPSKSRMPENGVQETTLIRKVAQIRQERMARLAEKWRLPGLKQRGDFWVALVEAGDWDLQGDAEGMIEVKPGRRVRVR